MEIHNKTESDPVTSLYITDAYFRWALQAAEEVIGKNGLNVVLRQGGLERLIDNYPSNELKASGSYNYGDYASLFAALLDFYGRGGKGMVIRIGKISTKYGVEQQGALFGLAALLGSKLLPVPMQVKMGVEAMQSGFRKLAQSAGQEMRLRSEDRGDRLAYIAEDCPFCAGKHASEPMCMAFSGSLQEAMRWQIGKDFAVEEVECRATGGAACVWEISKKPKL